jgi:dephospho-CoA kinase
VKQDFDNWLKMQTNFPLIVKEAAILFESGSYKDCDAVITVVAPLDIRIQRVVERDKTNSENVMNRVQNQWTDEMRVKKSDYVVENVSVKKAILQVDEILKKITNL